MTENLRVVIVGGVAAGPKTAARLRRIMPEAQITMVEKGRLLSYAGCGLPYYVEGIIDQPEELFSTGTGVPRDAAYFKKERDINVLSGTEATMIDRAKKEVVVRRPSGEEARLPYDKLVIATGAGPMKPPIPGLDLKNVYFMHHPDDAVTMRSAVARGELKDIVIIGAGLIGMETAEALTNKGVQVSVVEMLDRVLPALLDKDMATIVQKYLEDQNVEFYTSDRVLEVRGDENGAVKEVQTANGVIPADGVLVATGVRPNTKLAKDAGLEIGKFGGIIVDEYLRTSDPDIYAGGDCVENISLVDGKRTFNPLGSTANKHGRIIANNIAGANEKFPGVMQTAILKIFDYTVARGGLCEDAARAAGEPLVMAIVPQQDRAHYYPGHQTIITKLIADSKSGRLLGFQIVGPGEAAKRADVLVTAMTFGATLKQIADLDLSYAPPFNTAIDAAAHAANVARNKAEGTAESLLPSEVEEKLQHGDDFVLLDVRTPGEFAKKHIPGKQVKLIPVGDLRQRLSDLPKDKEIVTYCAAGVRAYEAARILKGAGIKDVKFMDGSMTIWTYDTVTEKSER
jgi:NADPH-dependent 2,4-dienoyl-CoA reductase/sulfur reductase-like enzyme/rhodanese-related sulfurtransferase